jgi:hypothetical protein
MAGGSNGGQEGYLHGWVLSSDQRRAQYSPVPPLCRLRLVRRTAKLVRMPDSDVEPEIAG